MTINPEVLERYAKRYPYIHTFIETGTFEGSTALEAAKYFERVYTVELLPEQYRKAGERFFNAGELGRRISPHLGDSGDFLRSILPTVQESAFIYLDAHFSGFGPEPAVLPLWAELEAIWEFGAPNHPHHRSGDVIAIDDIRLCGTDTHQGWKETTLSKLVMALHAIEPRYQLSLEPGIIPGDVLVAHL